MAYYVSVALKFRSSGARAEGRPPAGGTPPIRQGRRAVLRAGFAVVLGLLVFSTVEAYRIQSTVTEQHLEIYRDYINHDEALSRLRRHVLLGSTHVRDFFLSTQPDRAAALRGQLDELKADTRRGLEQLEESASSSHRRTPRSIVEEYWRILDPVPETMENLSASAAYDFIQREIVPRRSAAYTALRQLTEFYQDDLQKQELEFAQGRQAAVRLLVVMLLVCVVVGIAVAWWSMRYAENLERQTVRQYDEVAHAKQELQQLSARLIDVQEEERRRLSRGMHDEIGQTLTALRIEISHALSKAEVPEVRERLERARALAERTVQSVRDISVVLRPALLDDLGLVPALQWQAEDFARRSGIVCDFLEEEVQELLPDSVKTCAYRVVQEALNNCEKHAAASRVHLAIRQRPGMLSVEVADDGRGFELDAKGMPLHSDGIGLVGMRERAARLGGALVIESSPGRGTRVLLEIPLAEIAVQLQSASAGGEV